MEETISNRERIDFKDRTVSLKGKILMKITLSE